MRQKFIYIMNFVYINIFGVFSSCILDARLVSNTTIYNVNLIFTLFTILTFYLF